MGFRAGWVEVQPAPLWAWQRQGAVGSSAPAWVFVHGFADEATGWAPLLRRLSAALGPQVVLDLPGHGRSPMPEGGPEIEAMGAALEAAARATVGAGRDVVLVGSSMGGLGALRLAQAFGPRARAVALLSPAGAPMSDAELAEVLDMFTLDTLAKARRLVRELGEVPPLFLDFFARNARTHLEQPALRALRATFPRAPWVTADELARMPPTLLVWGQRDRVLPASGLAFLRAHLPAASTRVETPAAWGHVPFVERPGEVAALMLEWARGVGGLLPRAPHRADGVA